MKLILLGLCIWSVLVHAFDPTKVDYCKISCIDDTIHLACNPCILAEGHTEMLDDIMTFREKMIHTHNELRNKIASGGEYELFDFPSAANMKAISYDMELEYIARCVARRYVRYNDTCFIRAGYDGVLQNIMSYRTKEMVPDPVTKWYSEIESIEGDKEEFVSNYSYAKSDQKHFVHVVWANTSIMGCARVSIEVKSFKYHFVVICNYAYKDGMGNGEKTAIYKVGKPCSDCSVDCNKNYTALCGEITIPTDEPYDIKIKPDDETTTSSTDEDDVTTPTPEVDNVTTPTPEVDNVTTTKSEVITAPSHYNYTTPNNHNKTKRNRTHGKDDDYDYGYDGLDDDYKPRISITARITSNITLVFVGTIVIRWFK